MHLKERLKGGADRLPYIRTLRHDLDLYKTPYPPGHFYSPIPSLSDVSSQSDRIFRKEDPLLGIDLNDSIQFEFLDKFSQFREQPPFYEISRRIRYNIQNDTFSYDDGPILNYMLRTLQPAQVIEVGSGNSSACALDTNDLYLDGKTHFTFIDPNCDNLNNILQSGDTDRVTIIERQVQVVDLALFEQLQPNDVLFIDSSHVMKIGSDLHTIIFEILPRLKPGVYIHFHDVRYPFQYYQPFLDQGYYWNEAYVLRAFLQYNVAFKIVFWLNYLLNVHNDQVRSLLPFLPIDIANDRYSGGSIWLAKDA